MPSPQHSKAKGRNAENAVVAYLATHGYPYAERRRLYGTKDRGDIAGVIGRVVEVKDEARTDLAGWISELAVEMANDGADTGAVIRKRKGYPYNPQRPETVDNVGEWYAILPVRVLVAMWNELDGVDAEADAA